ncbi:MAG: glycosyltransferase [Anaerolineales bacterium]|uniref:glycosyltransferase n=1 Tax=Candidatus Villigracilis vicinus TaxID=3140679 RepID=UPI003134763E|nr:glycosyltransferase [Anaerolineales bacterium]MBK7450928.1 glycosyltransferase [Anaerolineales bacterium]MBK9779932.1 glycosyltransferase [Anaerolineales bacterium]
MESKDRELPIGSLRIGLFTDTYAPQVNGVSVSLQMISEGLKKRGHQVTIFAPRFPGYKDDEPNVMRLPSLKYLNNPPIYVAVLGTPRSTWKLTREHFDVLHAHSPASVGLLAYLTASTKRLPLIYTYHTSITDYTHYIKFIGGTGLIKRAAGWFSKASTDLGDQIVVPSPKFQRLLLTQKVKQPITVIPNGIDLSMFKTARNPGSLRKRLGIASDAPIMLTVGRMDPEKRLEFIVEAFDLIADRVPNAHLVFAGDGGSRKDVEARAAATHAKDRIHFLGMVNRAELPDIFHDADVFLSASTTEVHPISVIEAIASGLPMVAVQDEAFEGMIDHGLNGYLVPLDVNVYANTLADLLPDRERLKTFGVHSTKLSEKYSIESQVKALEKLYLEAILQNWRGNMFTRMMQKNINQIPRRINRVIRTEIGKMLPGRKKK